MTPPAPNQLRRSESSRRAILDAARFLVGESGYEHVSIEAIARRAGVGKQTIYRWWPSKGAVMLEALDDSLSNVVGFPDTGDVRADLRTQMLGVTQLFQQDDVRRLYQGLVAACQSDERLSTAHLDELIRPATVACHVRLDLAKERGELRADLDLQELIDLLYGAIYYRLLLHTRPLTEEQIDAALDAVFQGVR